MTRSTRARFILPAAIGGAALALASVGGVAGAAPHAHAVHATSQKRHKKDHPKNHKKHHRHHQRHHLKVQNPSSAKISEAGSSLLYPLWNLWADGYEQKYPKVKLETAAGGSGKGISGAITGSLQIGASDAYLSSSDKQEDPSLENIPLAISAQEVFYNVTGVTAHLKLSGKVLAKIYEGKISNWSDKAIASANPTVTLPNEPIVALHRSDGSGDTFLFTTYLTDSTKKTWASTVGYNTSVTWPTAPHELAETGNSGMVQGCKKTPGCIAYIGISYQTQALGDGLSYAQLGNGKGQFVLPTSAAISKEAAGFVKKTPKTGAISMIDGKIKTGYPIINYEYAIVSKKQSHSEAKAVRSALEWAINPKDGNSSTYLDQVNFHPLPKKVARASYKQIRAIK